MKKLGYNPARLALTIYTESVIARMDSLGFDLIDKTIVESNDSLYRWDHYEFARYTNLVFKHRELALAVLASHREKAGTNKNGRDEKVKEGDPNFYKSYWQLEVVARWANDDSIDWKEHDTMFGDFVTHRNVGGSYGYDEISVSMEAHAMSKNGEFQWDQRIPAYELCQPILQFMANKRAKMARGKVIVLYYEDLISSEVQPSIFFDIMTKSGALARIKNITQRIANLPEKIA